MPIYEYECTKCGHQIEEWQSFSDPPIVNCQLCKGKMRKLISQSSFHLKGTGWYVTDYASKRNGNVGKINKTDKDSVMDLVPPYVYKTQNDYMECPTCHRVYWQGTHWLAMKNELEKIMIEKQNV